VMCLERLPRTARCRPCKIRCHQTLHGLSDHARLEKSSRSLQSAVEPFLKQPRIFQKFHNFVPNDLIEQFFANRWVIANCTVEIPPFTRTKVAIVDLDLPRARTC
jgi:hypothetical protein